MTIKNEATKTEPLSPWLSYINVDDNGVLGCGKDIDLAVNSDNDWESELTEKLEFGGPYWPTPGSSVAPEFVTGSMAMAGDQVGTTGDEELKNVSFFRQNAIGQQEGHLGNTGNNEEVWYSNSTDLESFQMWKALLKGPECAPIVPSSTKGQLHLPAYAKQCHSHSWTMPLAIVSDPSHTLSALSATPHVLSDNPLLMQYDLSAQRGELGAASVAGFAREGLLPNSRAHFHQDNSLGSIVSMKEIELSGNGSGISSGGKSKNKTEQTSAPHQRDNSELFSIQNLQELQNGQNVPSELLYMQQQSQYLWDPILSAPTTAEGSGMESWAASQSIDSFQSVIPHQMPLLLTPESGLSRASTPSQTEIDGLRILPSQHTAISQARTQAKTQAYMSSMVPMAPMVSSSFLAAGHDVWPEARLGLYPQAQSASLTLNSSRATGRTRLPNRKSAAYRSSSNSSLATITTDDEAAGQQSDPDAQQRVGATNRASSNSSAASSQKSPMYKTRRVTRRQQEKRQKQQITDLTTEIEMKERDGPSCQDQEVESWPSLLSLETLMDADRTSATGEDYMDGVTGQASMHVPAASELSQQLQQPFPSQVALPSSPSSLLSDANQKALQGQIEERMRKDNFLLEQKRAGLTYKQIRRLGGFHEAESTLRGRHRTLTKPKEERVRKPTWMETDDLLLRRAVRKLSRGRDSAKARISWKAVADFIYDSGGSYHFGNTTCRKRWDYLMTTD